MSANETSSRLLTFSQFTEAHPAFTVGGLRHLRFRKGDELEAAGAVVRFGRRVMVDEHRMIEFIRNGGARQIAGKGVIQ
ncbi:hypothetical protein [Thioalkalivibrio sp. ALJ1]|uniref:hypothetical protein n=1 Tax=Thioalkalivibrio sp. ALJ1 TaxID=1158144 RepID=UPI000571F234|nr:hypothetical protein [Thioalkalivibrio sp. ALJ1]